MGNTSDYFRDVNFTLTTSRSFQRLQPGLLASLIVDELEARNSFNSTSQAQQVLQRTQPPDELQLRATPTRAYETRSRTPIRRGMQTPRIIRLGLPEVTGSITIKVPLPANHEQNTQNADERFMFRLILQLPTWVSHAVLDSSMYRSQCGWTHQLRTYHVFQGWDSPWDFKSVSDAVENDDLELLLQHFENRVLTPFDEKEWCTHDGITYADNLLTVSFTLLPSQVGD